MSYHVQIQGSLYVYIGTSMVTSFLRTDIKLMFFIFSLIIVCNINDDKNG